MTEVQILDAIAIWLFFLCYWGKLGFFDLERPRRQWRQQLRAIQRGDISIYDALGHPAPDAGDGE